MRDPKLRVWRAGPVTLVVVSIFTVTAGIVIPILAYLIYKNGSSPWLPVLLIALTVLALLYAWRFGFHPRLRVSDQNVEIINPFRRYSFDWDDITVIAPGENGLLVGSEEKAAEAWCVQKSNLASRRGRVTRADRIVEELLDVLDVHDPPVENEETGVRIRRARPEEGRLLTRLERAANEDALAHIFPPQQYPFPVSRDCPAMATGTPRQAHAHLSVGSAGESSGLRDFRRRDRATPRHRSRSHPPRLRYDLARVCLHGDLCRWRPGRVLLGTHRQSHGTCVLPRSGLE